MMAVERVVENKSDYRVPGYGGLWEKIISELFEEFMLLFDRDLYEEIDFSKTPKFLQQDHYKEIIEEKKNSHTADQIVRVYLKNGTEKWILIHIEMQAKADKDLSEQMFRYFYRIYDRFDRDVHTIALIMDDKRSERPEHFHYSFLETKVDYQYDVYNFNSQDIVYLEQSTNPFAVAVIAGICANKSKYDVKKRFYFKRKLMKQILKGFPKEPEKSRTYMTALFYFIDYILQTPNYLQDQLERDLSAHLDKKDVHQMHAEKDELSPTLAGILHEFEKKGRGN
jgi:hypothetical protein